ncbi:TIGR00341 family protein [soil metagenome]
MIKSNKDNIGSNPPARESELEFSKAKGIWRNIKGFLTELLNIHDDTDRETTVESIKKDISFKGHNAWILVFSIFVASLGLNVSSTAVVIGAMLISPLMGPIVGVGLSVAINDVDTLKKSFLNLGVMVGLSVLTAFIYFLLSPVKEETPELLARTYPTILDVLIAIFGGLALIVAKTKRGTIASVIFGVAIATALMPPLCTVGYGLAIGNVAYALGALYLFSINAVFIALSTFVVSKFLKFPLVKYANSKKRKRTAQIASTIAIVMIIPSLILFWNLFQKQVFEVEANRFLTNVVQFSGAEKLRTSQNYKEKEVEVFMIGQAVPEATIETWRLQMKDFTALKEANLTVRQGPSQTGDLAALSSQVRSGILEDLYVRNQEVIENKDARIELLEKELLKFRRGDFSFINLSREIKANYETVETLSYATNISTNFERIDTIPTFTVTWRNNVSARNKRANIEKMQKWLQIRLQLDTLAVRSQN